MSQPDGGPAFPTVAMTEGGYVGMTLRQWYAGMALQGLLAGIKQIPPGQTEEETSHALTELAYLFAEAMLRQREAPDRPIQP